MDLLSASTVPEVRSPVHVFIQTLGSFNARVGGADVEWKGGGASVPQLRKQTAYTVFKTGRPVLLTDLRQIAGGRSSDDNLVIPQRPFYVVTGFCSMLKSWGMNAALLRGEKSLTLQRSPVWLSDVDAIEAANNQALLCERAGDLPSAIPLLSDIVPLCNGDYLHEFTFFPEERLAEKANYWLSVQREALMRFVRLCLRHNPALYAAQAYAAARRAIDIIGGCSADDYDIAADAAQHCGHQTVADYYRYIAERRRKPKR